ncbi:hypothetical protein H8E52_08580 [bacterium]|nr:hypothetical protein [bacterium]
MRVLLLLMLIPALAAADYVDPYGLPSGSASLALATQEDIGGGFSVEAFDFATAEVLSDAYIDHVSRGIGDLIFFELEFGSADSYLRAPEGTDGFDRSLIGHLGPLDLGEIQHMVDVELSVTALAVEGDAYVLLQIQAEALPETTAVKFRLSNLSADQIQFDWAWQPNSSRYFEPSPAESMDFGELKRIW